MTNQPIIPGAIICILGDGQLGKMSLVAAHQLGYKTMVWYPSDKDGKNGPAMDMATYRLRAPFDCPTTLDEVIRNADVITTEWENVPLSLIHMLERRGAVVRPSSRVLEVAQSRLREKVMARELSIPTTRTVRIVAGAIKRDDNWSPYLPGILKTDSLGYDGKGQWQVNTIEELVAAHMEAGVDCVLEKQVDLACELSVLVARTADGCVAISDVVQNSHKQGILDRTVWPISDFTVDKSMRQTIADCAEAMAEHLELEGVLCLEFFVDKQGNVLFNEMAPRPHNSFHGSIEAAWTSQFEQHIRAICGLPLGDMRFHTPFEMKNLIGGTWEEWAHHLYNQGTWLHLYGKVESRPGRKMGHVTILLWL